MKYYSALKKKNYKNMAKTWVNLKDTTQSKGSQSSEDRDCLSLCMFPLLKWSAYCDLNCKVQNEASKPLYTNHPFTKPT